MSVPDIAAPIVKGWCPGALRPMLSGDGYLVRVRPPLGRLSAGQVAGLAELSAQFGAGLIELSSRANLQLRGVNDPVPVQNGLRALGLLDIDAGAEARRNVMVQPFWRAGDETHLIAQNLQAALVACIDLDLSGKFGFAVDCGAAPVLSQASADIRIERSAQGLIVRADGAASGCLTADPVATALDLATWFQAKGTGRMARFLATAPLPKRFTGVAPLSPIHSPQDSLVGFAFGRVSAEVFAQLGAIRLTPWRMVLVEQGALPTHPDMLRPDDPLLQIAACPGAPDCAQGLVLTRAVARHLAAAVPQGKSLHISGCAKGCAHPRPADFTLTGQADGRLALIRNGCAGDAPVRSGLDPQMLDPALMFES